MITSERQLNTTKKKIVSFVEVTIDSFVSPF